MQLNIWLITMSVCPNISEPVENFLWMQVPCCITNANLIWSIIIIIIPATGPSSSLSWDLTFISLETKFKAVYKLNVLFI